jgi:hypothetical protein
MPALCLKCADEAGPAARNLHANAAVVTGDTSIISSGNFATVAYVISNGAIFVLAFDCELRATPPARIV